MLFSMPTWTVVVLYPYLCMCVCVSVSVSVSVWTSTHECNKSGASFAGCRKICRRAAPDLGRVPDFGLSVLGLRSGGTQTDLQRRLSSKRLEILRSLTESDVCLSNVALTPEDRNLQYSSSSTCLRFRRLGVFKQQRRSRAGRG